MHAPVTRASTRLFSEPSVIFAAPFVSWLQPQNNFDISASERNHTSEAKGRTSRSLPRRSLSALDWKRKFTFPTPLIRNRQIHVSREVKNPAAIRTGNNFLLCLACHDRSTAQLHVTPAAGMTADSHHDVGALVLQQPLVFSERFIIHCIGQLRAIGFQTGQLRPQILFARVKFHEFAIDELLRVSRE